MGHHLGRPSELDHHQRTPRLFNQRFHHGCERGVDGFRLDAGYVIPFRSGNIIAHVRLHFPDAIFLLEGLGGAETADDLLTDGQMVGLFRTLSNEGSQPHRICNIA